MAAARGAGPASASETRKLRTDRTLYEMVCAGDVCLPSSFGDDADADGTEQYLSALRVLREIDHCVYTSDRALFRDAAALREVLANPHSDRAFAARIEMHCIGSVERALAAYCMNHCKALMRKIVYNSSAERKNKSALLFDLIFFTLCRCRCALATWQSAREAFGSADAADAPAKRVTIADVRAQHYAFAVRHRLCCEVRPVVEYTCKDVVCAVRALSDKWTQLHYCDDIERYVDALALRVAMLIVRTSAVAEHDMRRFRVIVGGGGGGDGTKTRAVANYDFVADMGVYLYSFRKAIARRRVYNTATAYDLCAMFNDPSGSRARLLIDATRETIDRATVENIDRVCYETSIYDPLPIGNAAAPAQDQPLLQQRKRPAALTAGSTSYSGVGADSSDDDATDDEDYVGDAAEDAAAAAVAEESAAGSAAAAAVPDDGGDAAAAALFAKHAADLVDFEVRTARELAVCRFVNDELVKFYGTPRIPFHMLNWLQAQSLHLHDYGEETMRVYRKMCLSYSVKRGEALMHTRKAAKGTRSTIEMVLKDQRGVRSFNAMQESLNKDPHKIFPSLKDTFAGIVGCYEPEHIAAIAELRRADVDDEDGDDDDDDGVAPRSGAAAAAAAAAAVGSDATPATKTPHHDVSFERSETNGAVPTFFEGADTVYTRTQLDIFQTLLAIKIIDAYFVNYCKRSFVDYYVVYERSFDSGAISYTRSRLPVLVQTFNTFQVYYQRTMYDVGGNFLAAFYLWLRIVDRYHDCTIGGHLMRQVYAVIFGKRSTYTELCTTTLERILADDADADDVVAAEAAEAATAADSSESSADESAIQLCL